MRGRRMCVCSLGAALMLVAGACSDDGSDTDPDPVRTSTVDPSAPEAAPLDDDELIALGVTLLDASGARDSVRADEGAELELATLARTYCATARRSDLENASATFRYSLAEFFGRHGVVPAVGEPQDATLARAMLAGTWGEALEVAAREQICDDLT
ncbi:MAG: hypothetical protein ACK4V6_19585 [Microthrixaceae bacterium]